MTKDVSPALLLDLYELTMADAYRIEGMADERATFSLFARSLPDGWGYLVAAGLADCLDWLEGLRFGPSDLAAIERLGGFSQDFLGWLSTVRFEGSVRAVREGSIVFPGEPILEVEGPLATAQLAETFLLNQITLQTGLATEAARCRHAAQGRAVIDFSLRRAPGVDAGMKLARCSRLVGLDGTSNVAGADRYRLPASGTMAHSFVQAHVDETTAFRRFAEAFKERSLLLVDTYDAERGIDRAIEVALEMRQRRVELRGIRIDSGDLAQLARLARTKLDSAGFPNLIVFVSGGLDEHRIQQLLTVEQAPIDGFGVGTSLGAAGNVPTLETVYKLVVHDGRPVRKTSAGKAIWPGAKQVFRQISWSGDTLALAEEPVPDDDHIALLEEVMRGGERTTAGARSLAQAADHFEVQWRELPDSLKGLQSPAPYAVLPSTHLQLLTQRVDFALANSSG
ncbi:MAG TPA: nicotinate phosphoribosyltransferase [Candidatus Dormibacteraeota bacterium]|nr:nicotinate phosphoribosyltransferase [Candidatus Dormibacteraeota bacterium]